MTETQEKIKFVEDLKELMKFNKAIKNLNYKVFIDEDKGWKTEFLVLTTSDNEIRVKTCTGNSRTMILKEFIILLNFDNKKELEYYNNFISRTDLIIEELPEDKEEINTKEKDNDDIFSIESLPNLVFVDVSELDLGNDPNEYDEVDTHEQLRDNLNQKYAKNGIFKLKSYDWEFYTDTVIMVKDIKWIYNNEE